MKEWTPVEIRDFRERLGLYQKDFAVRLGVTRQYIGWLEKGVRRPGKTLRILLNYLEEKHARRRKEKGG